MTDGRVKFEVFPAGMIGSPLKVTETVKTRVAQAGHHWVGYDWGVDKATVVFGGYPGSMPSELQIHWLYEGGGLDLWKQWRAEKHGIIGFPCGVHADEIFMHSRKPVRTLADMKGLKLRTAGIWAEIASRLGASTVILPPGEIYGALERGVIDATEFATPGLNYPLGFHKAAKYAMVPGVHQPSSTLECLFNKDVWNGFSARDRESLELAGKVTTLSAWLRYNNTDVEAIGKLKSEGVEFVVVDKSVIAAVHKETRDWANKTAAAEGGWFAKVLESQRVFMKRWEAAPLYRSELK